MHNATAKQASPFVPCLGFDPTAHPPLSSSALTAMLLSSSMRLPPVGRDPPPSSTGGTLTLASPIAGQPGIFVCVQPVTGWHVSAVHASPSEQSPHARQLVEPGAG